MEELEKCCYQACESLHREIRSHPVTVQVVVGAPFTSACCSSIRSETSHCHGCPLRPKRVRERAPLASPGPEGRRSQVRWTPSTISPQKVSGRELPLVLPFSSSSYEPAKFSEIVF